MLPLRLGDTTWSRGEERGRHHGLAAYAKRLLHLSHMDLEATSALMLNLIVRPSRVYRSTAWHRQTKGQWARDDPAFIAIQSALLVMASLAWGIAFAGGVFEVLRLVLWSVLVDYLLIGICVATALWLLANYSLRTAASAITTITAAADSAETASRMEWGYAFDIHQNGFFPLFLVTHVVQFFLAPLLLTHSTLSCLLSALLYGVACTQYLYITFLGYHALPFLRRTVWLLYPIAAVAIAVLLCPLLHFNPSAALLRFYFPSAVSH